MCNFDQRECAISISVDKPFGIETSRSFLELWSKKNATHTTESDAANVAAEAGGNPFYLAELLAHLARGGSSADAPASIRDLVQQQFNALSKPSQRALLAIALLQAHSSVPRIAWVLRLPPSEFVEVLDELELAGLVIAQGTRLVLRHDLIGDVALSVAPSAVLQYLGTRVASRLEKEGRRLGSIELLSDGLAQWERAGGGDGAYRTAIALGERLLNFGLFGEASLAFGRAEENAASLTAKARSLLLRVRALGAFHDWDQLERIGEALNARTLAMLSNDERDEVLLTLLEAEMWAYSRDPNFEMLERLFRDDTRPPALRTRAALIALIASDNALRASEFLHKHDLALASAASVARQDERLLMRLIANVALQHSDEALATARELLSFANQRPQGERVRLVRQAAHAMLRLGLNREAIEYFRVSFDDAQDLQLALHQATCLEKLTLLYLQVGEFERASRANEDLQHLLERLPSAQFQATVFTHEARLALVFQDHERAHRVRDRLLGIQTEKMIPLEYHAYQFAKASLEFAFPEILDEELATWCRTFDRKVLGRGANDLSTATVAAILVRLGDIDSAVDLVVDYFSNIRVERGAPSARVWALVPIDAHPCLSNPSFSPANDPTQLH